MSRFFCSGGDIIDAATETVLTRSEALAIVAGFKSAADQSNESIGAYMRQQAADLEAVAQQADRWRRCGIL